MDRRTYQRLYGQQQRDQRIANHRCIRCQSPLGGEGNLTCGKCLEKKHAYYERKKAVEQANIVKFDAPKEICHGWYVHKELEVPWSCPEPGCGKVFTQRSFQKKGRLLARLEAQEASQGHAY